MREVTIARNYAEALFVLGERAGEAERFGDLITGVGGAVESDETVRVFLESPRVTKAAKQELVERALKDKAPEPFIRFLGAVIKRGRQGLFAAIAREYVDLLDVKFDRVRASVVLAREPNKALQKKISSSLAEVMGKEVIAHFRSDPNILGGVIVRVGDRVMDGSIRRRMKVLRRQMMAG